MKIFPVAGRLVRDPVTQRPIDAVGADIDPNDLNWSRLLADGDVIAAPPEKSTTALEESTTVPEESATQAVSEPEPALNAPVQEA